MASTKRERNPGIPLNLAWVEAVRVNLPALIRRAETHKTRRSVKMDWQAAWLLRAVTVTDLTTLSGDDTESNVERLCFKAKSPVRQDLIKKLGVDDKHITVGAVCVYPSRVAEAVKFLEGSLREHVAITYLLGTGIPVASVAAGFPAGQTPLEQRLEEIRYAVAAGAREIDIVITRPHVLNANWKVCLRCCE